MKTLLNYFRIKTSGYFNRSYYLDQYPDVRDSKINPILHFIRFGWKEGRSPSEKFDTAYYLDRYPDVKRAGINPLIHFLKFGRKEGRHPLPMASNGIEAAKGVKPEVGRDSSQVVQRASSVDHRTHPKPGDDLPENLDKVTFFIHIGQGKTGSSIIQNFLDINRDILAGEHGCLYPNFYSADLAAGRGHNHHRWFLRVIEDENALLQDLETLKGYLAAHAVAKVILSDEGWELDDRIGTFFKTFHNQGFKGRVKFIMYVRRIDSYVESAWKQWGLKVYDSIEDFYTLPINLNRYQNTLNHLENLAGSFGRENIIVRPYEKGQLPMGLLHDFLTTSGIDYGGAHWRETEAVNTATNRGFNRDVLEVLHHCRGLFTDEHDNRLFDLFDALLGEHFQKAPFESYALLSPAQRIELLTFSAPFEEKIARDFMGRPDGKIFYEPIPENDGAWKPYEGLTLERVIPILIKMIDENNRNFTHMQQSLKQ